MYFQYDGKEYRLAFEHRLAITSSVSRKRNMRVTVERTLHTTIAAVFLKDPLPIPKTMPDGRVLSYEWVKLWEAEGHCSEKDQFSRKLGREVALGRLVKKVGKVAGFEVGRLIAEAYMGRMKRAVKEGNQAA